MAQSDARKGSSDEISPTSSDSSAVNPKSKIPSYECKICGAPALHSNYGAITCYPCKMFFKRHVTIVQKELTCNYDGHCDIDMNNRHTCSACRLRKCFGNKMQAHLIRGPLSKQTRASRSCEPIVALMTATSNILQTESERGRLLWLPTTNLLQAEIPGLSVDQWTLLSNVIYSYQEQKLLSIARQFLDRSQATEIGDLALTKEFFMKIYELSGVYIRSNSDFCKLPSEDRSAFLRNIAENVACFGAALSWAQSQIDNCQVFVDIYLGTYGEFSLTMIREILKFLDTDIIMVTIGPMNTLAIAQIQDVYAEVTWKYLLHKYEYSQSIKRFNRLTQCLLAATATVSNAQNIATHVENIRLLVEHIELLFVLDDLECIDENKNSFLR